MPRGLVGKITVMSEHKKEEKKTTPAPDTHSKDTPKPGADEKKKA
jgi:hypothetical protein